MDKRFHAVWPLALLLAAGGGCQCSAPDGVVDDCQAELELPPSVSTDILFVIDNSGSMQEEQQKVVDELHTFVQQLVSAPVRNDFQLGVVTTGVSQNSALCGATAPASCVEFPFESGRLQRGKDLAGKVLDTTSKKLLVADDPDLLPEAQVLLGQGTAGSGQEMGLEAARRALSTPLLDNPLDGNPAGNKGFLRPGARLLVIIVSDEDDCSDAASCADSASRLFITSACPGGCTQDADCQGEGHYCLLVDPHDPGRGRSCSLNACETPAGRARLAPVDGYVSFLNGLDDGTGSGRKREVFLAVIGAVDAAGAPARCQGGGSEAYGVAVRYQAAVTQMGARGLIETICKDSYADALTRIATLVNAPQTVELARPPPDPRLILFDVTDTSGATKTCRVGEGFDYEPPAGTAPARVTFKGTCRLSAGDQLKVRLVCAN
ncbi:MAG: VWA domain-containing protein [Myxococcales bacterium]